MLLFFKLRPEDHADSLQIMGEFGIDQSYFPEILQRLDDMIEWQN